MKILEFLKPQPLLPHLVRAMEVIAPMATFTGAVLMPYMMATFPAWSFMFWLCLVMGLNSVALPIIALEHAAELDFEYSCYLAITRHEVFRGGQLVYRANKYAILTGTILSLSTVIMDRLKPVVFWLVAWPCGIAALIGLALTAFWDFWLKTKNRSYQGTVQYSYQKCDPESGKFVNAVDSCRISALQDNLVVKDLELMIAKRRQELNQDD